MTTSLPFSAPGAGFPSARIIVVNDSISQRLRQEQSATRDLQQALDLTNKETRAQQEELELWRKRFGYLLALLTDRSRRWAITKKRIKSLIEKLQDMSLAELNRTIEEIVPDADVACDVDGGRSGRMDSAQLLEAARDRTTENGKRIQSAYTLIFVIVQSWRELHAIDKPRSLVRTLLNMAELLGKGIDKNTLLSILRDSEVLPPKLCCRTNQRL